MGPQQCAREFVKIPTPLRRFAPFCGRAKKLKRGVSLWFISFLRDGRVVQEFVCMFVCPNGCVEKGSDNSTLLEAYVYAEVFFCSSRDASFTDGLQFPQYLQSKGVIGI